MTRVLVAGGAGFLGSHLCDSLVDSGHSVTVVDDLSSGRMENIQKIADKIQFIKGNIVDCSIEGTYDIIINMASRASRAEWEKFPVEIALSNSLGNKRLIEYALKFNALYLFASTSEVYGNPEVVPTPETYLGTIDPLGSRSPYDESKRFGETLVRAYEKEHNLKAVIVRFFNTYGPRMRGGDLYGRVIDRFLQQARSNDPLTIYGDGTQTRSFTYVSDTVDAITLLLNKGKTGEVYNVGSDSEIPIRDLADTVIRVTQSKSKMTFLPLPPDDPKRRAAEISRIRALGWRRSVSLEDGIRRMFNEFP